MWGRRIDVERHRPARSLPGAYSLAEPIDCGYPAAISVYGNENIRKLTFHLVRLVTDILAGTSLIGQQETVGFPFITTAEYSYPVSVFYQTDDVFRMRGFRSPDSQVPHANNRQIIPLCPKRIFQSNS